MSSARPSRSGVRSGLRGRSVEVPLVGCPDCGEPVKCYRSSTDEHDGWVFYKCTHDNVTYDFWRWEMEYVQHLVETRVLVGNAAVDAIGAAEDRMEDLERKRTEWMAGRNLVGRGLAGRGIAGRVNFDSPSEKNLATKQQVAMLLGLGREILLVLKLLMASVVVLCVLSFIFIMKK
ncbi:hypothetical protein VPH35_132616 [Triticum aestivum]